MILTVPYQALQVGNIHITPFSQDKYGKSLAKLSYKDPSIDFQDVSILTPPLKVIDYNPENSRLRLDLSDQFNFNIKLNTLQEYLISTFYVHQQSFLNTRNDSTDIIKSLFHFLLNDNILSLYIFPTSNIKTKDNTTCKMMNIKSGDTIRCVIRLQGISQIYTKHGIRLRLQHSVPSIWMT
jgi:dynactin complex subunit